VLMVIACFCHSRARIGKARRNELAACRSRQSCEESRDPSRGSLSGTGFQPVDLTGWKPVPLKRVTTRAAYVKVKLTHYRRVSEAGLYIVNDAR